MAEGDRTSVQAIVITEIGSPVRSTSRVEM
jgi:hypothetical protein